MLVIMSAVLAGCGMVPQAAKALKPAGTQNDALDNDAVDLSTYADDGNVPLQTSAELRARADKTVDLGWLATASALTRVLPGTRADRPAVLAAKQRATAASDAGQLARANAVLASEAFTRSALVVAHWLDKRDPATGLIANLRPETGVTGWFYQNTGADLYPHITIGARLLMPSRYGEMLEVLNAERRLTAALPSVPDDLLLPGGQPAGNAAHTRIFGAAEYAKDGLLPLVERLGPDPWLARLREMADVVIMASATPTRRGSIPANSNEVNGDMLQVLARVYWATGDDRYAIAAERIGETYLEDVLPKTAWLPSNEWDFEANEPVGRRRLRLSDHGNEILLGLVEWHLIESLRGEPDVPMHRAAIRKMMDRLLERGRNPDGLWYRVVEIPSGKVDQKGLSDNWGYIYQAFLTQAAIERGLPGGEVERAERYEQAVRDALRALPRYAYYPWQRGEMDGYADSLESALYLLPRLPDPEAAAWMDEQIAVLFGSQGPDGVVEDNYLDGNFVRTALLYGLSLTSGAWLDPWRPDLLTGAATSGSCLEVALGSVDPWTGRLHFDQARHREHLRLPFDYPRLNEWPEGFVVEAGHTYEVQDDGPGVRTTWDGAALSAGLPLRLEAGAIRSVRVCRVG